MPQKTVRHVLLTALAPMERFASTDFVQPLVVVQKMAIASKTSFVTKASVHPSQRAAKRIASVRLVKSAKQPSALQDVVRIASVIQGKFAKRRHVQLVAAKTAIVLVETSVRQKRAKRDAAMRATVRQVRFALPTNAKHPPVAPKIPIAKRDKHAREVSAKILPKSAQTIAIVLLLKYAKKASVSRRLVQTTMAFVVATKFAKMVRVSQLHNVSKTTTARPTKPVIPITNA